MTLVTQSLWASLPVPALIVDAADRICDVNPAAETFLNARKSRSTGIPSGTRSSSMRRWRRRSAVSAPATPRCSSTPSTWAPAAASPSHATCRSRPWPTSPTMCLSFWRTGACRASRPGDAFQVGREIGDRHGRDAGPRDQEPAGGDHRGGAALSMNANGDLELTDLIVAETRRIVKLLSRWRSSAMSARPNGAR
jgi:two-component system nitrogen regulation sensor histidine kinase GlnL